MGKHRIALCWAAILQVGWCGSLSARAYECAGAGESGVRLDDSGSLFAQMPVYNQDAQADCYAYSAAQLVDYWRIEHDGDHAIPREELTSPTYVAMLTKTLNASACEYGATFYGQMSCRQAPGTAVRTVDSGQIGSALSAVYWYGTCPAGVVRAALTEALGKADVELASDRGSEEAMFLAYLEGLFHPEVPMVARFEATTAEIPWSALLRDLSVQQVGLRLFGARSCGAQAPLLDHDSLADFTQSIRRIVCRLAGRREPCDDTAAVQAAWNAIRARCESARQRVAFSRLRRARVA